MSQYCDLRGDSPTNENGEPDVTDSVIRYSPPEKSQSLAEWLAWLDALPYPSWCGVRSTLLEEGRYECVLDSSPVGLNFNGAVNGAITVGIADHCMGAVAAYVLAPDRSVVTASLNSSYLRPALLPLTFRATLKGAGNTLAFVEIETFDRAGKLCLHTTATMAVRNVGDVARSRSTAG